MPSLTTTLDRLISSPRFTKENQIFAVGDLFLFFGWFDGRRIFQDEHYILKGSPDLNIYGYLQIGDLTNNQDILKKVD